MKDLNRIDNDKKKRKRQKDVFGTQDVIDTVIVPVSGQAGTAFSFKAIERVMFDVAFAPERGSNGVIPPAFSQGFSLKKRGLSDGAFSTDGLVGIAKLFDWIKSKEGYFVGAIIHVGVANLGADAESIPFVGEAHLTFIGRGIMTPF